MRRMVPNGYATGGLALGFVEVDDGAPSALLAPNSAAPTIALPPALHARVAAIAAARGRTVEDLVSWWLTQAVDAAEAEARIKQAIERGRAGKDGR